MMYAARINHVQLQCILGLLEGGGFIRKHDSTFSITDKGRSFLEAANNPLLELVRK